jgi:hypothetical protein
MERLRVLAGEPLLVIDFRYHLVSLIAVFLAIALGIIIGTTALNEPIQADIEGQVTALQEDKRALENQTRQLQAQVDTADAFGEAVAPALVAGALADRSVLLIAGNEGVAPETVEELGVLVEEAGGSLAGTLRLQPAYSDPATASSLRSYVTGPGLPPGVQLPTTDDAGQLVGALLAQVLMIPADSRSDPESDPESNPESNPEDEGAPRDGEAISSVLAGLTSLGVLNPETTSVAPADYVVFLTSGAFTGQDAAERNSTLVDLITALDAAGSGAVVAGNAAAAEDAGLVGVVRADPGLSAAISTVDNLGTAAGRVSAVLALGAEGQGTSGSYGTGEGTQPAPPVPAATP